MGVDRRRHVQIGIDERLADARTLWRAGRRESGLLLALVAVAARSRLERPDVKGDKATFVAYVSSTHSWSIDVEYQGKLWSTDLLLYTWLRCELVHVAGLPIDLVIDDGLGDGLAIRAGGAPEHVLRLSPSWFDYVCWLADGASPTT